MSRITPIPPPVKVFHQIVRSISLSSSNGRPSSILNSSSRTNAYLPRGVKELKAECSKRQLKSSGSKSELAERLAAHDLTGASGFHSLSNNNPHRPIPRLTTATSFQKTIPLMQGFRTSAPQQAAHDTSTIDYAFLPSFPPENLGNPFSNLRVPLLPDNYTPDRSAGSAHAVEELDQAVPGSEISVVASNPAQVAAPLSEVVGNDGLDVDIGQLMSIFSVTPQLASTGEPGLLKELWNGLIDDIFGPKGNNQKSG